VEFSHELILPNQDIPFKMFLFEGYAGGYRREKHWHRSIELFAVFKGSLKFYIDDQEHLLNAGDFMLVNSNEIHSITAKEINETVVVQIPVSVFENYYTDDKFIFFSHSSQLHDEVIMDLIANMYQSYSKKKLGYEFDVQGNFYHLLYILVSKYREENVEEEVVKVNSKLRKLSAITSFLKDNYKEEISLESISNRFGYSPTYLSRMFQKYAKINFKTYLDNIRLEHAYRDLMNTDMKITDIAYDNGFASTKAFSKIFKSKYNALPSEFRKREIN
jgi:AraC-like DNA-binding protein/quercetin dioxygenase-like cupin family protein